LSVLVTGIDTVLGYHISRALSSSGFKVRGLVPAGLEVTSSKDVEMRSADSTDVESLASAMQDASAVFHCEAGRLPAAGPIGQRAFLEGTRNVLLAMARSGIEELVYAGSALAFRPGPESEPGNENEPWDNPLGLPCLDVLRASSELVQRYNESGKVRCVTVSPTLVMGECDMPGGAGWWLIEHVARQELKEPGGSVNVVRAADAASATVKALGRGRPGASYIIGGHDIGGSALAGQIASELGVPAGEDTARASTAGRLVRAAGRLVPRVRAPESPLVALGELDLCYDSSLASEQLELRSTPLRQTVHEAVEWYVSRS
jgi:dihydroflavonol-4-reductase